MERRNCCGMNNGAVICVKSTYCGDIQKPAESAEIKGMNYASRRQRGGGEEERRGAVVERTTIRTGWPRRELDVYHENRTGCGSSTYPPHCPTCGVGNDDLGRCNQEEGSTTERGP